MYYSASFDGHFTNHFLSATTATRLFEAKVDKQLIMQRTGHTSSAMRAHKHVDEKLRALTSDVLNGSGDKKMNLMMEMKYKDRSKEI